MIYYYFYWRNAYLNAANQMIKMVEEEWRKLDISLNQLKEGQNIIVYSYREALDTQPIELTGVQMIVVLNDEI